jgi:DNA-binding beta-propeller fold protein YncE
MTLRRVGFAAVPPGPRHGFDHADVSRALGRMYVAHTGADCVDVFDARRGRFLRSLHGLPGVAGVLVDDAHDRIFTTDRGAATVSVFRRSDERLLGRVEVGAHPNALAYDRRRRRLYTFNLGEPLGENCTVSVVDPVSMCVAHELPLPGRPRWALYDAEHDRIYANILDPPQVVVIDARRAAVDTALGVPCEGPHGLWLDDGRLYCAADGGRLVVLERESGEVLASMPLPGVPDVVMHDPSLHRLYVAVGDPGLVCSFDTAELRLVEIVTTEAGAHTMGWDPDRRRLWVFCPRSHGAAIFEERA